MDGVIDPPSSMHRLTLEKLKTTANNAEVWSLGPPLSACVVLSLTPNALYVGKLGVMTQARGQGLARRLIEHAAMRAKYHDRHWLELQVRMELTENHAAFTAMGFHETGRTTHAGYNTPTSITYRRVIG
jgi:GNAT superfamily N-acetyltransferase